MAKETKKVQEAEIGGSLQESQADLTYDGRDIYPTGFRNIDTNIGFRVYDEVTDELLRTNRGVLSGSWITYTGVPHSGKTTLSVQHATTMMRPFIREDGPDRRVQLHVMSVENGLNHMRFQYLSGWSQNQIATHVRWAEDCTLEGLNELITTILKVKEDKNFKPDKKIGYQGKEVEIYPPTFILIDAVSELVSRDVIDIDNDVTNTMHMRQHLLLDQFVKKYKLKFAKYNINILAIAHLSKKIDVGGNPMAKPIKSYKALGADEKINGGKALEYATDMGIHIKKIEASDADKAEKKGGKALEASAIKKAILYKNRQGLDNVEFYLVSDKQSKFDPLSSFVYECQQEKIIESAGAVKKITGTEFKVRSQDLMDAILTDADFRNALFVKYDELKDETLESVHANKEERERISDILDVMML